jgi:hypothetical protein
VSASRRPMPMLEPLAFSDALATALQAIPADAVVVAEDTRLDTALLAWGGGRVAGSGLVRTPQDQEVAVEAAASRPLVAAQTGRAALELFGLRFRTAAVVPQPIAFALHRATSRLACVNVDGSKWSPLPGLEYTGRLGLEIPAWRGARLDLVVGDAPPFRLQLETPDRRPLPLAVQPLQNGPGLDAPPPDYWLEQDDPFAAPARVLRASVPAPADGPAVYGLQFGRRAPRVLARMFEAPASLAARVCAAPLGPDDWFTSGEAADRTVPFDVPAYFGAGWHGREREGARPYRWTARESVLLVPSARQAAVTIGLTARPAVPPTADLAVRVTPTVNGVALAPQAMAADERVYQWFVPAGTWVAGTNEIQWSVSQAVRPADRGAGDTRVLGMLVYGVTVTLVR